MNDLEIIQRVKDGETSAFSLLVEKYHRHLLNFIYTIVFDKNLVEDIGQEVFLSIYASLDKFDKKRGTPFSAWLFTIARNRCISEIRRNKNLRTVFLEDFEAVADGNAASDLSILKKEQHAILEESIRQLPEPFKHVLIESLQGKTLVDIAKKNGISTGTAKSRLFRAKQRLKLILTGQYGE